MAGPATHEAPQKTPLTPRRCRQLNASPRQARWREARGQRREERGGQAPGPGLGAAQGSMRASQSLGEQAPPRRAAILHSFGRAVLPNISSCSRLGYVWLEPHSSSQTRNRLLWVSLRHFSPGPCALRSHQVPLGFQIRVLRPPSAIRVSD